MIDIDKSIKEAARATREKNKKLRSPAYRELAGVANALETALRAKGFDATASDSNSTSVAVSLHLTKTQSLKQMSKFLAGVAKTRLFEPADYTPYPESAYVTWTFRTKSVEPMAWLHFAVWFSSSATCRRVSTGNFIEEYKTVCDEIPAEMLEL